MAKAARLLDEVKPGAGVDRTLIRELLKLTPTERAHLAIAAARSVARLKTSARPL
ncbi:MAG: hypothetical protein JO197_11515 [Acidobacteria bacterium]|nr:hypothetical protein [Acidobacteriota bacterium]MBV9476104.1 hypothetical protein [Acidobacteriota bacterium]